MRPVRHPLHCLSLALFALLAIVLAALAGTVQAQTVSVTGGAVQSNDAPATYTSLTVSGTGPGGAPSTYSANAPLGLGSLTVSDAGIVNANADVTVSGSTTVGPTGTLRIGTGGITGSLAADVFNQGTLIFNRSNDFSYAGTITGTGETIKLGSGTMTLAMVRTPMRVSAGGLNSENGINIGRPAADNASTAVLTIDGGTVQTDDLNVGYKDWVQGQRNDGSLTMTSGSLVAAQMTVAFGPSTGRLNLAGGTIETEGSVYIGYEASSNASAVVSGGSWTHNGTMNVGYQGSTGTLDISGGLVRSAGFSISHSQIGSSGTVTVTGGTFSPSSNLRVNNNGTLSISGNGLVTVGRMLSTGSTGTITLGPGGTLQIGTGGTTGVLATDLTIGGTLAFNRSDAWSHALTISGSGSVVKLGVGTLTLAGTNAYSGGTQVLAGTLKASNTSSFGTGTIVLSSGATLDLANLTFSNMIVNNGGTILNGAGYSGTQAVSSGTATITGPTTGTVVVDTPGATAQIAGTVTGTVTASNGGTVVITGSVAPTAQVSVGAGSTVSVGNGATIAQPTLTNAGKFAVANTVGSVVVPTAITGTGSFEKTGGGSVQLTGSSNFTGGSTIASGQVVVQNAKALGSGGVTISSGGKLLVDGVDLNLGGAAVQLVTGAELATTSGARVTVAANSDLSGVRSASPASATAAILAGTAVSGTLATTWTTSTAPAVKSEVLQLKTPTSASNPFVLSLSYGLGLDPAGLFLGWNDPISGDWVNAVAGNQLLPGMNAASGGQLGYLGSFSTFQGFYGTNLASYLGAYGRDDSSRTVWAVVNHNSEFAVTQINAVPEPGTWALAVAGLAGMAVSLRRKARAGR